MALLAAAAHAQPAASILEGLAPLAEIAPLETPPMAAALFAVTVGADEPERFADPFEVDVSPATHGRWETTPDGRTAVWRLPVVSTGAVSLNFGFTRYRMPEGGRLRVLTLDGAEIVGPYTDADNKTHGELWTPLVSGGEAVIEVTVPASRVGELELDLGSVNRGFRDILGVASRAVDTSCQIDAVCPAADPYRDQVRSVALIVLRGIKQCSGALLNNTARDGTPYFLTAGHCGDLEDDLSIARGIGTTRLRSAAPESSGVRRRIRPGRLFEPTTNTRTSCCWSWTPNRLPQPTCTSRVGAGRRRRPAPPSAFTRAFRAPRRSPSTTTRRR